MGFLKVLLPFMLKNGYARKKNWGNACFHHEKHEDHGFSRKNQGRASNFPITAAVEYNNVWTNSRCKEKNNNMLKKKLGIGFFVFLLLFCLNVNSLFAQNCPLPSIPEDWCHCSELYWDAANPDEMSPNSSAGISVVGGCPNYKWEVNGDDFWFDAAHTIKYIETETDSTALYTGDSACGSATIIVTDDCGDIANGSVRSTATGHWEFIGNYCGLPGNFTTRDPEPTALSGVDRAIRYWKIVGNKKQYQLTGGWGIVDDCPDFTCSTIPKNCQPFCEDPPHGPTAECIQCIASDINWPCNEYVRYDGKCVAACSFNKTLAYYEWECP